ncbi:unnamed protein product [Sordaria macrospora k-hell]|uniref:WGS project CABT00000000 data, contig 2.14 n=1 Tax=Sordaria macrospora (strain ATCC MYA-333 / DSM 997 / K(L3346) / K-hell) TaxID=771870 RepID=F7VZ14_SORMK|nr:uncharacterized protein SMAC_04402 [Sordaria macrospora k-hell]CCC10761.1 unnamed protein product [Sordaria macrospora k-hell]
MVRATPEYLAARTSMMSLRAQALEQSLMAAQAYYAGPQQPQQPQPVAANKACAKDLKPEAFTKPYLEFMTENPTVFHAVGYFKEKLEKAGYKELHSRDSWSGKIQPGGKYFTTRNGSSIIAWAVGKAYKPGNGLAMVAGHIDALTARLKPTSTKPTHDGYVQLGIAQYAGALNSTWWDRDLSIGGRVIVKDPETGKTSSKLVKLDWPIARIPTLAPHFGIGMTGHNNQETEMTPIIGLDNSDLGSSSTASSEQPLGGKNSFVSTQPPKLVKLIASQLKIEDYSSILNWELELYDSQPAQVGGIDKEFIFAGRIDDKLCSWAAFMALLHARDDEDSGVIKLVALFDDEEIGSLLRQGARGNFLPITIERTVEALVANTNTLYQNAFTGGTGLGPASWTNLSGHSPRLNVGVALCVDASAHMTTDSVSMAILDRVAELSGCINQRHMIRNDSRSGGTVGPMLSSAMGVKAADVGIPQLSMHSIRATTGSLDPGLGVKFYKGFLDEWEKVDGEWRA